MGNRIAIAAFVVGVGLGAAAEAAQLKASLYGETTVADAREILPTINLTDNTVTSTDTLSIPLQGVSRQAGPCSTTLSGASTAGFGHLHTYAYAKAVAPLDEPSLNQAGGGVSAQFYDEFTIQPSPGHPIGSRVMLNAKMVLHSSSSKAGFSETTLSVILGLRNEFGGEPIKLTYNYPVEGSPDTDVTRDGSSDSFWVGSPYTFYSILNISTAAQAGGHSASFSEAMVDAGNTMRSYFWSNDPSVIITTASGNSYAVPEPASLGLLLCAGLLLGRRSC